MTDQASVNTCDHHYEHQIRGGEPLTVSVCQFCRMPDWADLREQVAGIRAAARQAAGQPDTETAPGDCTCGSASPPFVHYRDCPQYNAPAVGQPAAPADRAAQYGQVLRRWGLLDEVNDPKATEEFAVTDLLTLVDVERAGVLREVAGMFEAEVNDCPAVAGCPPCDVRTAFAARLRRIAAGAES